MNQEKKRILEMVKEGLLNADEALLLLEQIEKKDKLIKEAEQKTETSELATVVNSDHSENKGTQSKKSPTTMDKLLGIVDDVVKKIKDVDFDLNFGSAVEIEHIYHQDHAPLQKIDVDLANGSVKFLPWDKQEIRIECHAKMYRTDDTEEARKKFLKEVTYSLEDGRLRFAVQDKSIKLQAIIRVPNSRYEELKIRLFNGTIVGENVKVDTIKIKTGNGQIQFSDFNAREAEFETVNGVVNIKGFDVGELEVETINGAIQIQGGFRKGDLQTINGSIQCEQTGRYGETIRAKASAGSINLQIPANTGCNGELKSNLGSFNIDLKGIHVIEEKSDVVQKMLRFQSEGEYEQSIHILAESRAGNIKIKH